MQITSTISAQMHGPFVATVAGVVVGIYPTYREARLAVRRIERASTRSNVL